MTMVRGRRNGHWASGRAGNGSECKIFEKRYITGHCAASAERNIHRWKHIRWGGMRARGGGMFAHHTFECGCGVVCIWRSGCFGNARVL